MPKSYSWAVIIDDEEKKYVVPSAGVRVVTVYYTYGLNARNTTNHVKFRQTHGSNTGSSKSNVEIKFKCPLFKYQTCFCSVKMLECNCRKQIFLSIKVFTIYQ